MDTALTFYESLDIGDGLPDRLAMGRVDDNVQRGLQPAGEALGRFSDGVTRDPHFWEALVVDLDAVYSARIAGMFGHNYIFGIGVHSTGSGANEYVP